MEKQLPYRVKESSEYLNLKKMEEHMARQKMLTFHYSDIQRRIRFNRGWRNYKSPKKMLGLTREILKLILQPIR